MTVSTILLALLRFAAISAAIYLLIALALVLSQSPEETLTGKTIDFSGLTNNAAPEPEPLQTYQARDGTALGYRHYGAETSGVPLLVFIHGSGWHGAAYDWLARQLSGSGRVEVALPDLRGHGPAPGTRGDVAYIGQLEDDIADLVAILRKPGQKLVVGGHSSGGGLAVRYAGGGNGGTLDGAVLVAPYLKYDAPTMRPNSGGWARSLTRRIIGLSMLNAVGVEVFNHLTVLQLNFPGAVLNGPQGHTATASYSYRLNTSYAPRSDYLADIAALPSFLLVAGEADEAFIASAYEPVMKAVNPGGRYELLPDESHLGIVRADRTAALILDYLDGLADAR